MMTMIPKAVLILLITAATIRVGATGGAEEATFDAVGRVVDEAGKPVAGAKVVAYADTDDGDGKVIQTVTTAADGRFELKSLRRVQSRWPVSSYLLIAEAKGFAFGLYHSGDIERIDFARIVLRAAPGSVAGRVADSNDQPIANARVAIRNVIVRERLEDTYYVRPPRSYYETETDVAGMFTFNSLPPNAEVHLEVRHPQFGGVTRHDIVTGAREAKITLHPPASLEGRVVGEDQQGIAGVRLYAYSREGINARALTEATGSFRFTHLSSGDYTITPEPSAAVGNHVVEYKYEIAVKDGEVTRDVVMRAVRGGVITGKVLDEESGQPIPDAGVSISRFAPPPPFAGIAPFTVWDSSSQRADRKGEYRIVCLPAPSYVSVSARGYALPDPPSSVMVGKDETVTIDVKLRRVAPITGVAIDTSGKPVEGALVSYGKNLGSRTSADEQGRFVLHGSPQPMRVWAAQGDRRLVGFAEARSGDNITITLHPAGIVEGRIVDTAGRPVAGAAIGVAVINRVGGRPYTVIGGTNARTDADGRYVLDNMWGGDAYYIHAHALNLSSEKSVEFTLAAGEQRKLDDLVLRPALWCLAGEVFDGSGKPIRGASVSLMPDSPQRPTFLSPPVRTDAEGKFRFEGLTTDPVTIRIFHNEYEGVTLRGVIPSVEDLQVTLVRKQP